MSHHSISAIFVHTQWQLHAAASVPRNYWNQPSSTAVLWWCPPLEILMVKIQGKSMNIWWYMVIQQWMKISILFSNKNRGKRIQTVQLGIWWIGLRENLQNTMALPNNNQVFLQISPWSAVPKSTWTVCLGTLGTTQIPKTTWISNRCFWFWRPRHRTIERSSQPSWNCLEKLHEAPGCLDGWYYQATSHSAHHQTRSTAA